MLVGLQQKSNSGIKPSTRNPNSCAGLYCTLQWRSCMHTLNGVQKYIRNFGFLAGYMAQKNEFALSNAQRDNLKKVSIKLVIYAVTCQATISWNCHYHHDMYISGCIVAGGRYRFLLLRKPSAMHPCVSQPYFLYEVTSNPMLSSDNVHYS